MKEEFALPVIPEAFKRFQALPKDEIIKLLSKCSEQLFSNWKVKTKAEFIEIRSEAEKVKGRYKYGPLGECEVSVRVTYQFNIIHAVYYKEDRALCHLDTVLNQVSVFKELQALGFI